MPQAVALILTLASCFGGDAWLAQSPTALPTISEGVALVPQISVDINLGGTQEQQASQATTRLLPLHLPPNIVCIIRASVLFD